MPEVLLIEPKRETIYACHMSVGEIGIADDGEVLLRCYDSVVSLTNPQNTWRLSCTIKVAPVPPGTTVRFVTQ